MNAMQWVEQTMTAEQTRLDTATGNLANAHVRGYAPQTFSALLDDNGIHTTVRSGSIDSSTAAGSTSSARLPDQNAATVMIEVLQAQRDFETAQKIAVSIDSVRAKESSEMARSAT